MANENKIEQVQQFLTEQNLDGWLLYDFRRSNDLACRICGIEEKQLLTRRFFYWIPKKGEPVKIVHAIENPLENLQGKTHFYKTWQELQAHLKSTLIHCSKIAMEYSKDNAIPVISKVDAGTVELIRSFGVEVDSSADLLQAFTSTFSAQQFKLHEEAALFLSQTAEKTWGWIKQKITENSVITEFDVQQFIWRQYAEEGFVSVDLPICAVNENSANPHYNPSRETAKKIERGDFILIDLWCKKNCCEAVYADITRVGVAAEKGTAKQNEVFNIVRAAQKKATLFVEEQMDKSLKVCGFQVDQVCRQVIEEAGYGPFFIHRTGHSIDINDHGSGANIDDFETHDTRQLIPRTCFSIEPGIYLPGEFGVRLEYDVFLHADRTIQITGGIQEELTCLF